MTTDDVYRHDGTTISRRTTTGKYSPIGQMADEDLASYTAAALNALAEHGRRTEHNGGPEDPAESARWEAGKQPRPRPTPTVVVTLQSGVQVRIPVTDVPTSGGSADFERWLESHSRVLAFDWDAIEFVHVEYPSDAEVSA